MKRVPFQIRPALAAAVLAIACVPVVASLVGTARMWWWVHECWWSAPAPFTGPHESFAWIVGGLVPAAAFAGAIMRWADRRSFRLAVGVWGLAQIAFGALAVIGWEQLRASDPHVHFPTLDLVAFALAGLAAIAIAAGLVTRACTRREALGTTLLAVVLTAVGVGPSIGRAIDDARAQPLPAFQLELVAVYDVFDTQLVDPNESLLEHDGVHYRVDLDDTLVLTEVDVHRVRWELDDRGAPGFTLVLRGPAVASMRARSIDRIDQQDAFRLDGRVFAVAVYANFILEGSIFYAGGDRPDEARAMYRALTGSEPPG